MKAAFEEGLGKRLIVAIISILILKAVMDSSLKVYKEKRMIE